MAGGGTPAVARMGPMGADTPEAMAFRRRYGLEGPRAMPAAAPAADPQAAATPDASGTASTGSKRPKDTNEISSITITFRAVSLTAVQADANKEIVYSVLDEIQHNSQLFDAESHVNGSISAEEPPGTFTFPITVELKRPLKP